MMNIKASNNARKKHLKILFYIFSIIAAFLIQTSIFPLLPFLSATPNLLLVLTFSFGFLHGNFEGMLYGLGAGLLMDLFYSGSFGFYSLIFIMIGYFNGFFSRFYYSEYISLPMLLCALSVSVYHIYIYVFRFLIRGKLNLPYYLVNIVLPSIVFSLLVTLVLYRFFFAATERLDD